MSSLNEESVEKKLKTVNTTQDSIQSLSLWIIHHKTHHAKIVQLWLKVIKRSVQPAHRLTLFYLANDVIQTCKKKKAPVYNATFKEYLPEAARLVRDLSVKNKIERIFKIWQERGVYDSAFVTALTAVLDGKPFKLVKATANVNDPISPVASPYQPSPTVKEDIPEIQTASENSTEDDIDESTRILAEFKPHEMIEQITVYRRQELEIQIRSKQLSHLRLDASSLEAVKQLKDRAHGNEFSGQFEDSCTKLEDLVKRQTQHLADQKALLDTLKTSETFYDAQYREARIVANAYKNFGARINNMKKKLDEMKKTMPKPESPIPSPDVNAPSPENSPPTFVGGRQAFDYNASNSLMGYEPAVNHHNAWNLNGKDYGSMLANSMDNTHQDSPPLEAPSPEGSPTDLNLDGSETGNASLDSRLASFMGRNHRSMETSQPAYMPSATPVMSQAVTSVSSHSNKPSSRLAADEDGNNTPLDDEAPTTPVQDEHTTPPPKKNNTPPKKENPIDFLSRLISQTQKTPTTKTGAASFLDSLTMLSNIGKPSSSSSSTSSSLKTSSSSPEAAGPPMVSSQQQQQIPPPPPPWSWNASTASAASQPSSPTIISSQATSPTTPLFSRPPPSMVPPPPIPPIAMVPPPRVISTQISPPVNPVTINLSVPPPPPPPFPLGRGSSIDFTSPPPPFPQQTSPGQKENWPEKGLGGGGCGLLSSSSLDHTATNVNRSSAASSSVLMELTPSKGFDEMSRISNPLPPVSQDNKAMNTDAMEIVSDDEEELDALVKDSDSDDMGNEAHEEFASKLKEKTTGGDGGSNSMSMKSSVIIPNTNLVTVSVSDDMDEEDMIVDKDSPAEGSEKSSSLWSSSHKSHKKKSSRSRSRSRERSSHKHKKKKKHKRKGSDEDDDERGGAKKISSRSSARSSKDSKYDRFDDRGSSKYEDKYGTGDYRNKYDKSDDKKYSSSSSRSGNDYKSGYHQPPRDGRDPRSVEAYTQAFIQQYSQARFGSSDYGGGNSGDPRRSGYKY